MTDKDFFIHRLQATPVVAIIRGLDPATATATAIKSWAAGIALVEVSLVGEFAEESLAAVVDAAEGRHRVGAGTVLSPRDLERALEIGATWAVAPNVSTETLSAAADAGCPMLPGVATATDLAIAMNLGYPLVKAFPAAQLGPGWMEAMRGPFPAAEFVAVGGITASNARTYLDAGAAGVGMGSGLTAALPHGLTFLD
ncbi:MAG: bifunctional 4-hydroxy-2-oxoglutarate aldolase/2-dehydro-3-deoxy-phosphogluconate aldolase [Acidobacteria bacterium]|nr:bifunctional 4-hydroxy-2-oxoglutarate aldolase/2-dehydro-3-deoxy-phosphogluconate aldolase [Acidobacteriota bacterium]MCH8985534.1 bifunctional 4-hydroxy-2-oxoglutarate aldolase/2-dehydro-3-deoxy-phosphogluconate aldolase [Acidobacteriota bacterium]